MSICVAARILSRRFSSSFKEKTELTVNKWAKVPSDKRGVDKRTPIGKQRPEVPFGKRAVDKRAQIGKQRPDDKRVVDKRAPIGKQRTEARAEVQFDKRAVNKQAPIGKQRTDDKRGINKRAPIGKQRAEVTVNDEDAQLPPSAVINYSREGIPVDWENVDWEKTEACSFSDLGVSSRLCRSLSNRENITNPTPIQIQSLPHTLEDKHKPCIIQSETGTGKTLTYLLPALQDTALGLNTLIVTPTRELAIQVYHVARRLAGNRKDHRRVNVLFSGTTEKELMEECRAARPNILIGTGKILYQFVQSEQPKSITRLVLDEGDNLLKSLTRYATWKMRLNRSDHPKPARLIAEQLLKNRNHLNLICTSATVPTPFREELAEIGWESDSTVILATIQNKRIPSSIRHEYIQCFKNGPDKVATIVEHFRREKKKQALVFIHRDLSVNDFVEELVKMGIRAKALYSEFLNLDGYEDFVKQYKSGEIEMVVGTEETVRGLDFNFMEALYLTEVPRNTTEYLHLAGRVGRMGQEGVVVVLVEEEENGRFLGRLQRMYKHLQVEGTSVAATDDDSFD